MASRETISAGRLAWLRGQIGGWRADGLIGHAEGEAIEARCAGALRARAARTVLLIGAALFGIGLIGVVAANLDVDEIGPLVRSLLIALVWLTLAGLAEVVRHLGTAASLANPIALLAAIAYGATIFQVTQSLQVPAFEPALILVWAVGSLVYAYATRHSGPLVLGVGALAGWYVWELAERADVAAAIVLGMALGAPLAAAVAALHEGTALAHFTGAWRFAAALLGLAAFGVLAIGPVEDSSVPGALAYAAIAVVVVALLAAVRGDGRQRIEIAGALVAAAAAVALVAFAPETGRELFLFEGGATDGGSSSVVAHALVSLGLFFVYAAAIAYLGQINGATALTGVGIAAIVLFFITQAFALTLALGSTAWLLLGVGVLLAACGVLADLLHRRRARA